MRAIKFRLLSLLSILLSALTLPAAFPANKKDEGAVFPEPEKVERLLRAQNQNYSGAVIVALSNGEKHRIYAFGTVSEKLLRVPDESTIFEIGSITKVFTSLLLCDLWLDGKLSFNDQCRRYLDPQLKIPTYGKREISIFQLATHSSGLARDPDNLPINGKYSRNDFHQFLRHTKLKFTPGSKFLYSNCGYRLLGEVLEGAGKKPFETQLQESLLAPLGLSDTSLSLAKEKLDRLAQGHDKAGEELANTPLRGSATGGLKSSAGDLLRLLDLCLSKKDTRMSRLIEESCKRRYPVSRDESACLGWFYKQASDSYGKYGQIDGFSSCIEFSPAQKSAIVVLSATLQIDATKLASDCARLMKTKCYPDKLN